MKIAIASSGLGHVARGIETWAMDVAAALAEQGVDVTLFCAESAGDPRFTIPASREEVVGQDVPDGTSSPALPDDSGNGQKDANKFADIVPVAADVGAVGARRAHDRLSNPVILSDSVSASSARDLRVVVISCLKRSGRQAGLLARMMPGFAWRWGLKSPYGWEQFTFWLRLWPCLRQGKFDILHVQDPMLAYWCRKFRKLGLVKTKEILAHGTEEPIKFLEQFDCVQHLAPWHLEQALKKLKRTEK